MAKLPKDLEKLLDGDKSAKYPTSFYLTQEVADAFKAQCKTDGKKPSHVVEALIRWYLAQTVTK